MQVIISPTKEETGEKAAKRGAECIRAALDEKGEAFIILATGASQFDMLATLVKEDIDWTRVTAFHLDEYIGLPATHPASFRHYLRERFVDKLPKPIRAFHYINPDIGPEQECLRLTDLIRPVKIDVAFIGIGENGHLAFNDPPADFETDKPFIIVKLDEECRWQQMGEGWFVHVEEVPAQAISMSVREIMHAKTLICTVPDNRKAAAVEQALLETVTPDLPASILKRHPDCHLFLDKHSSSRIRKRPQG